MRLKRVNTAEKEKASNVIQRLRADFSIEHVVEKDR